MNWLPVKGFEGLYEVSEDGQQVRCTQKIVWFGATSRIKNPRVLVLTKGRYHLLKNGRHYQVKKEDIQPSSVKEETDPSDWKFFPAQTPETGKPYQVCIYYGQHTFFMYGQFDGKHWRNSQGRMFKTGYVKKFRRWREDFEE